MIEEEKEAIKTLEEILKEWQKIVDIEDPIERECEMSCYMEDMPFYQIKILLKLVEKQQKEIEELKEMKPLQDLIDTNVIIADYSHNYISKDKIREWLDRFDIEEDLQDKYDELLGSEAIYKFLKQLLKEN